jgi:hypothetical protein
MFQNERFFKTGSKVFWILVAFIGFIMLPYIAGLFYNEKKTDDMLQAIIDMEKILVADTIPDPIKDTSQIINLKKLFWSWTDFSGRRHQLTFSVPKEELNKALSFRVNFDNKYPGWDPATIYHEFIKISRIPLDSLAIAMQKDMQSKNISGLAAMNYVVTAIQTPPYTKVAIDNECPCNDMGQNWLNDCNARKDGRGCCNNVVPFAVFTPTEFIFNRTGDCDTKALIAYALLRRFNFKCAIIAGIAESGRHAMLGVSNVRPVIRSSYVNHNGELFYPWEVTDYRPSYLLGNMQMWDSWYDWEVIYN